MENYTLIQRNADFMARVRQEWRMVSESGRRDSIRAIIERVVKGSAPEFYVSYETAYRYISLARRGELPFKKAGNRYRMWSDLAVRVDAIMTEHKEWNYARAIVEAIDRGNAPSWYMDPEYARTLYFKLLREGTVPDRTLIRSRDM